MMATTYLESCTSSPFGQPSKRGARFYWSGKRSIGHESKQERVHPYNQRNR